MTELPVLVCRVSLALHPVFNVLFQCFVSPNDFDMATRYLFSLKRHHYKIRLKRITVNDDPDESLDNQIIISCHM